MEGGSQLPSGMPDLPHPLEQIASAGPWDGPSYRYRGAEIMCIPGGRVCGLVMRGHPLNGGTFGTVSTITRLVDLWLDEGRLARHIRQQLRL